MQKKINVHGDLSRGAELAIEQLGYKIINEEIDHEGYVTYTVEAEDSE